MSERDSDSKGAPSGETITAPADPRRSAAAVEASDEDPVGAARYQLVEEHGSGGLGRVLRARDVQLDREVAVKELLQSSAEGEARFVREAKLTGRLEHPGIVPIYELGHWEDGRPFYSMKLIDGQTLSARIEAARDLESRLRLLPNVIAVAETIAYAHSRQVIHRDIKPSNIIVGEYGETLVIDWGLVKDLGNPDDLAADPAAPYRDAAEHGLTVVGQVLGTPAYMSPEQARGEPLDARADVYALGAVLYHTLTGRRPYAGIDSDDLLATVRDEPPAPVATLEPRAPRDLVAIVDRAMARDPASRYATAIELAEDLKRFQAGQLVSAQDYSAWTIVGRWIGRHRLAVAATITVITAAVIGAAVSFDRIGRERDQAREARADSEKQTLALLEQQGFRELEDGHPIRAANFLAEAYRRNPDSKRLRWAVTQAVRELDSHHAILLGHTGLVNGLQFVDDGKRLVSSGADGTIRIWDVAKGEVVRVIDAGREVNNVRLCGTGGVVAVTTGKRVVQWDLETATVSREFATTEPVLAIDCSPDRATLAVLLKQEIRIFEADTGRQVRSHQPTLDVDQVISLNRVSFSASGERLAVITSSAFQLIDLRSGEQSEVVTSKSQTAMIMIGRTSGARWLPAAVGENIVALGYGDGTLQLRPAVPTINPILEWRLPVGLGPTALEVSASEDTWLVGARDGVLRYYSVYSYSARRQIDAHAEGAILAVAAARDGRFIATAGADHAIHLWYGERDSALRRLVVERFGMGTAEAIAFSADGGLVAVGSGEGDLSVWSMDPPLMRWRTKAHDSSTWEIAFAGDRVVTTSAGSSRDPNAKLWDLNTGAQIGELVPGDGAIYSIAASEDGRLVAASAPRAGKLYVWDTGSLQLVVTVEADDLNRVAMSRDGRRVAAGTGSGLLNVWDSSTGALELEVQAHDSSAHSVDFSADGGLLLTAGFEDQLAKVWDSKTGELKATMRGHEHRIMCARFSPSSGEVLTTSWDRTGRLWDTDTGQQLMLMRGMVNGCAFHPHGRFVATGFDFEIHDVSADPRSPVELLDHVRAHHGNPWHLVSGRLVPKD